MSISRTDSRPIGGRAPAAPHGKAVVHWLVPMLALLLFVPTPTLAQSDAELRGENAALRSRVRDLEAELDAARKRIVALEAQIEALRQQAPPAVIPTGTGEVPPPQVPVLTIDENDPVGSPLNLLRTLKAEYAANSASFGSYTSPRDRSLYLRNLQRWIVGVSRRYRLPVEWLVTPNPLSLQVSDRAVTIELTALDPGSGDSLGDPFTVTLQPAQFRRLETQLRRGATPERLVLRGLLTPQPTVNPQREREGTFNLPRFIGTFCELRFTVEVQTLLPLRESS